MSELPLMWHRHSKISNLLSIVDALPFSVSLYKHRNVTKCIWSFLLETMMVFRWIEDRHNNRSLIVTLSVVVCSCLSGPFRVDFLQMGWWVDDCSHLESSLPGWGQLSTNDGKLLDWYYRHPTTSLSNTSDSGYSYSSCLEGESWNAVEGGAASCLIIKKTQTHFFNWLSLLFTCSTTPSQEGRAGGNKSWTKAEHQISRQLPSPR